MFFFYQLYGQISFLSIYIETVTRKMLLPCRIRLRNRVLFPHQYIEQVLHAYVHYLGHRTRTWSVCVRLQVERFKLITIIILVI